MEVVWGAPAEGHSVAAAVDVNDTYPHIVVWCLSVYVVWWRE